MACTIAEVADFVGVPPSTLRYYEAQRAVRQPARAENGERAYEERDVASLRFVARAKQRT
ncbi:MAG: MerR family DNA-binding transcriptional regulator [Chloroflexi bacterium]|nr:MAG: MerR family DNA-binding transcriptional regulator [Chloroflexota bacterium]